MDAGSERARAYGQGVEVQFVREMGYVHTYEAWTIASTWEFFSSHGRSNFTMAANPASVMVASPGQSGSTTLTFTAENGLTGSATLSPSMCSNLPSEAACSFSPATIAFTSSTTTIPVTLTISTTASSTSGGWRKFRLPIVSVSGELAALCLILPCLLLLSIRIGSIGTGSIGISSIAIWVRQRTFWTISSALCLLVMLATLGCGGGGSPAVGGGNPGTPLGNYTGVSVTVTINGVTQSIKNLSVNVQ